MPDVSEIFERIEAVKKRHATTNDALTVLLLHAALNTHSENALAYLIVKAVLDGVLVPVATEG